MKPWRCIYTDRTKFLRLPKRREQHSLLILFRHALIGGGIVKQLEIAIDKIKIRFLVERATEEVAGKISFQQTGSLIGHCDIPPRMGDR